MPGISARISDAMSDPDFEIANLARIVSADPTVAGGLLQVANSAVFRGAVAVDSLEAAIIRLGAEQTRTLVSALAARSLFTARVPWVRRRLAGLWRHAVEMGAYCAVLAERTAGLDKSKALLLGLLHEIGAVPVLSLAEGFAELEQTPGILDATLVNLVPGLTSRILEQWHLPEAFQEAAQHQENWFRDHDGPADYPDTLVIGHLHGLIKAGRYGDLPRLDEIPAFQKLGEGGLTARASLAVLDDAQAELKELRALLS
jgi:HD-like signal output (HDOD) protein